MTPQSTFMVAAPIRAGALEALRALLQRMNGPPGQADPTNPLVPFGRFDRLHVARFVILEDATLGDLAASGAAVPDAPLWLVFLGDCDGPGDTLLAELAGTAGAGLRAVFAHCEAPPGADLLGWMRARAVSPAAQYGNWQGRTVRQIREDAALRAFLRRCLAAMPELAAQAATEVRARLLEAAAREGPPLAPPAPTPAAWRWQQARWLAATLLGGLVLAPLLLLASPVLLWMLRRREGRDPEIAPPPSAEHVRALSRLEDHDVSNAFSAFGSVKPGWFRLWTLLLVFRTLEVSTRFIYTRGRLARVGTIHFARWVFLDNRRRLLFASNYDGSLDSYMDDFINKAAFGLNLVFSNGIGWPPTRFLLFGGAEREQPFKHYLRRHQVPTQVWYKAYPGLTAAELAINTRVREGLQRPAMGENAARQWLALI